MVKWCREVLWGSVVEKCCEGVLRTSRCGEVLCRSAVEK